MIDQATIDKITDAADIVEVVSDFVSLRKRGVNYIGLCPFHDEKTPSFSVSPAKGICKCFSCGKGGTAVHFVMEHEQMSYYEALRYLAKKYNIEISERELTDKEKAAKTVRESMLIVNEFAQKFFYSSMTETDEGRNIGLSYFYERGFRDDIIKKFGLGYSPEKRDAISETALKNGYKREFLIKTGLCIESNDGKSLLDRFRGRVMFPVYSLSGKIIAFGGRVLKTSEKTAKYLNSPESEVYHKSNVLYGIYQAKSSIVKNNNCFLVEGYTDVLSMHQAGVENVVASSGTSLTEGQIRQIHRFTENITVLYDGDAAGIKASLRGIDLLLEEGMNIKVVLLPDGDDPDSFSKKHSASDFSAYIKTHESDFITFKTGLLIGDAGNDPIRRSALIGDIVSSIAVIPNDITRSIYIKECSRMMEMREEVLLQAVSKERLKKIEQGGSPLRKPIDVPPLTKEDENPAESPAPDGTILQPKESARLSVCEQHLIRLIIKYGLTPIPYEEESITDVVSFITTELERDNIKFENSLYGKIAEEAVVIREKWIKDYDGELFTFDDINSNSEKEKIKFWCDYVAKINTHFTRHFLNHPNEEISLTALEMVSEKYHLSKRQTVKSEEERMSQLVRRSVTELKDTIISERIALLNTQLRTAYRQRERDNITEILKELNSYKIIKSQLAKELGERIINPK